MFLKIVKHELYETGRMLLPVFGGLLLASGLARGSIWLMEQTESPVVNIIGVMMIVLFFLGCLAAVILAEVLLMVRFARSVHGDEGYLTHTLPLGTHAILLSRLLVSFLALSLTLGMVWLGIRLSTWSVEIVREMGEAFRAAFSQLGMGSDSLWLPLLMIMISLLSSILQLFAAISIGHSFTNGKTGKSILFYFVLSFASSTISSVVSALLLAANTVVGTDGLESFTRQSSLFSIILNLVFCGVYYFLTWITTRKRLNLA